jgi:hypothetical protein
MGFGLIDNSLARFCTHSYFTSILKPHFFQKLSDTFLLSQVYLKSSTLEDDMKKARGATG